MIYNTNIIIQIKNEPNDININERFYLIYFTPIFSNRKLESINAR
jgi:hypothetical protein